jgi:hypothetical protein
VVLICNLIVSFNHSLELFRSGGFRGELAYLSVIAAETTFILGALQIVVSRLRGESPGLPAWLGGILGVGLVSWSNVKAGWEFGIVGILLGLATPLSLVVAEMIVSRALLQRSTNQVEDDSTSASEASNQIGEPVNPLEVNEMTDGEEKSMSPIEVAEKIYLAEGRLPGRKRLAEEAGCSEWVARQSLAKLKNKIAS